MGKTISLKLNSSEEEMINKLLVKGVSPSGLLRRALSVYLNEIDEKVYLSKQEKNYLFDEKVNRLKENEVNQVNQKVNLHMGKEVNLEVNSTDFFSENMEEKEVNQKVNLTNQFETKYLDLYIEQLKIRLCQLEKEAQELKEKNKIAEQFLLGNYQIIQEEYHNLVKDSIKRIDDKFDRIMFYLEESFNKSDKVNLKSDFKEKHEQNSLPKVIDKKITEKTNICIKKPNKGWVFELYRM